MPSAKLTDSQRAMLMAIAEWADPDSGWCEVELQWSCKRGVPDLLVASTADRCVAALRRKGLVAESGGPELTPAGSALVNAQSRLWCDDGSILSMPVNNQTLSALEESLLCQMARAYGPDGWKRVFLLLRKNSNPHDPVGRIFDALFARLGKRWLDAYQLPVDWKTRPHINPPTT